MTQSIFTETGEGDPVVCLLDPALALVEMLADDFHMLALDPARLAGRQADARALEVLAAAKGRGLDSFALVAHGRDAGAALWLAATYPDAIATLVLLSPLALDADGAAEDSALAGRLDAVKAQTLALFGTRDEQAPPTSGGVYKRALASCHLIHVYDATDTARDRPDAVREVVADFLARRDAFLVNREDGRLLA